jgi:hypothetical protein
MALAACLTAFAGSALWHLRGNPAPELPVARQEPGPQSRAMPRPEAVATPSASPVLPARPPAPTAPKTEPLETQAREALRAADAGALGDALLALMDMGDEAIPALIPLLQEAFEADWFQDKRFFLGVLQRGPRLGGLMDALLAREGAPDRATEFALNLTQVGARSRLPAEGEAAALLALLRRSLGSDAERAGLVLSKAAGILLGGPRGKEALPEIERLIVTGTERDRNRLLAAVLGLAGPEAVASMRRMVETAGDAALRGTLLTALGGARGREMNALLWELEAKETEAGTRTQMLKALAKQPDNGERVFQELQNGTTTGEEQKALLSGLVNGAANGDKQARKRFWSGYDAAPASLQDPLLAGMLAWGDSRALDLLGDRLRAGQVTEGMAASFDGLDPAFVGKHAESFRALASNPATPTAIRAKAFEGLRKVDPRGALDAVMTGFPSLPAPDRLRIVRHLRTDASLEARAVLAQVGAGDPDAAVRQAAAAP